MIEKEEEMMKKTFILLSIFALAVLVSGTVGTARGEGNKGEGGSIPSTSLFPSSTGTEMWKIE